MPYLSCSSTNRSYREHLSLQEHLISDCYPSMLTCVGNFIQTYDETTQRTLLIWDKFSTYLNLPLKLDILWLPNKTGYTSSKFKIHPLTSNPSGCPSLLPYDSWSTKKTSVKFLENFITHLLKITWTSPWLQSKPCLQLYQNHSSNPLLDISRCIPSSQWKMLHES